MSQTETIMLIALGFVAALLMSLLVIRGVWRYGVSLGKRRIERRAPSAIAELKADRDRLKAEFAMQGRRLQLRMDDLKTQMAEQMAEASRNRNRLEQLATEIGNRDKQLGQRDAEIANLKSKLESMERELAEQTYMLEPIQSPAASIASASSSAGRSTTSMSVAGVSDDAVENRLRQKIAQLNELTRQIDEQRRDLTFQHGELTTLREQLDRSRGIDDGIDQSLGGKPDQVQADTPAVSLIDIESAGQKLEQQILDAERETESLTAELARLDALWNDKLQEVGQRPADADSKAQPAAPDVADKRPASRSRAKSVGGKTGRKKAETAKAAARTAQSPEPKKPAKGKKPETSAAAKPAGSRRTRRKSAKPSEAPQTGETKRTPEDNVISLAQRIRALQNDLRGKKP